MLICDPDVEALERVFSIAERFVCDGCEHGFKPAKACPNEVCETRKAQEAWERIQLRLSQLNHIRRERSNADIG